MTTRHISDERGLRWGARARLGLFLAFMLLCFLGGGGSRADIVSLLYLRPAATYGPFDYLDDPYNSIVRVLDPAKSELNVASLTLDQAVSIFNVKDRVRFWRNSAGTPVLMTSQFGKLGPAFRRQVP